MGSAACFDYMISDSNLDLKDSDDQTLQDTLAHDDVPPYNVWSDVQKLDIIQINLKFLTFAVTVTLEHY